jgi:hypothetical protein
MSGSLEGVIRPFETGDVSPAKPVPGRVAVRRPRVRDLRRVPRQAPALVAIDHEFKLRAHARAHGLKRTEQMLQEALARIKAEHDDSC